MKVLIISEGFYPAKQYGGPVTSIRNLCELIKEDVEIFVIANNFELNTHEILNVVSSKWIQTSGIKLMYLSKKNQTKNNFRKIVKTINPDCIYLNSLFSYKTIIPFLKIAKKENIKVVLATRGQLCKGAIKKSIKKLIYIFVFKKYIVSPNVVFQSTSCDETNGIVKYLNVDNMKIHEIPNIPSLPHKQLDYIRKEKDCLSIVFVSRIHPKKNLLYVLEVLSQINDKYKISLDIYGPKEDMDYWKKCLNQIEKLERKININYKGIIQANDVFEIFSKYELFFFPTFSENYGHVIAESLFSGCPVLISDQTPWNDVNKFNAGFSFPLNNKSKFIDIINYLSELNDDEYSQMRKSAIKYVNYKTNYSELKVKYINLFKGEK